MAARLKNSEYFVLNALQEGPLHGYALISALNGRGTAVPAATIYNALRRLRCLGLIEKVTTPSLSYGPARITYRLTNTGKRRLFYQYQEITKQVQELKQTYSVKLQALQQLL